MKSVCTITGASSSSAASITARAISRLLTLKEGTANLFLRMKLRNSRGLVTNMMKNGVAGVLKQSAVSGNANRAAVREFSRLRNTRGITGQSPLPERAKRPCADIPMGRSPGSQIPPSLDLPPSQTTARPDNQRGQDHRTEPRRRLGGVGFRPPMVSVKLPQSEVSGFSSLESNEVAKFFQVQVERAAHFESRLLLVLSCPFCSSGTRQPPIRHVRCDSA